MEHEFSSGEKQKKRVRSAKVHQIDYRKIITVDTLTKQWSKSGVFNAGQLGKAVDIMTEVYSKDVSVLVGLAGAMVPGGMRRIIANAIDDKKINALTTTGANITHDLIEAFGGNHIRDVDYKSDKDLLEKGIDRVYDSFVAPGSFENFETELKKILNDIMKQNNGSTTILTPSEIINKIGSFLQDENSIVRAAYKNNIPIFVPAFSDSILGLQIWLFAQFNKLIIDSTRDIGKIQDVFHKSTSNCALLLGGGVPKNFTLQAALMASKQYNYAIQITMDRVETGGLSGASLSEAISWGKIEPDAKIVTVISDITIALPILFSAVNIRLNNN